MTRTTSWHAFAIYTVNVGSNGSYHIWSYWPAHRAGLLFCNFFDMLTPVPYHHFFSSLILLFISLSFFTWCIWYINWSCWQSYITLSVLMFLWYRQKFFISLYGTRVPWVNMGRGQPGSVSKFPPFLWVKLWVGRGYTEITRYFPASWINWVTLVTKINFCIHWDFRSPLNHQNCLYGMFFLRLKAWFNV